MINMVPQELTVRVVSSGKLVTFNITETTLSVTHHEPKRELEIVLRQVIGANFVHDTQILEVSYLARRKKKDPLSLVKIEGEVKDVGSSAVIGWVETFMSTVYERAGIKRSRRLKVLVNPYGGISKGVTIFAKTVEPILRAAGCSLDVISTTHRGHAYEIAKALPLDYDAIITVSGDGLIHEVMNGFAHHEQPKKAFSIPIAPIPTGSGNGLSLNLLGIDDGFDVAAAALNVIKGRAMKVDVFSITQNGKRTISFMSQALGLMADLDIGTENLRWMGDARFVVGLLRGVIQFKPCPVQLSFKVAEEDKLTMAKSLQARRLNDMDGILSSPSISDGSIGAALPPLKYLPEDEDGWTTFEEPILYVYAGKGPYVGRDFMAFPVSLPDDGLIDVMAQPVSSRSEILKSMGGAAKGEIYWNPNLHYIKAHAYRVKPLSNKGSLAIDGEIFPFEEFQVEVHQGLATLLSPHGYYAADFQVRSTGPGPGSGSGGGESKTSTKGDKEH